MERNSNEHKLEELPQNKKKFMKFFSNQTNYTAVVGNSHTRNSLFVGLSSKPYTWHLTINANEELHMPSMSTDAMQHILCQNVTRNSRWGIQQVLCWHSTHGN